MPVTDAAAAPPRLWSRLRVGLLQSGLLLALCAIWEALVRAGVIGEPKFGQPARILAYLWHGLGDGSLLGHTRVTLQEELLGFAIGTVGGTAIGLGLWWSRRLSRVLEPFAVVFNGLPKIALAPPFIVWFGIYQTSKVVLAASICLVVAWLSAYSGALQVDRDWLDMVRALGGSRWQAFRRIVVPGAMPWILSGLRINIGFALIGAIVGEYVASNAGLGYLAVQAAIRFRMSQLWMVIFVITALAAVQYYALVWLERRCFAWVGAAGEGVRI
jgi:NitT/TauT family transport system permease protein